MYGHGSIWMIIFWIVLVGVGIYLLVKFVNGDNKNMKSKQYANNTTTPLEELQIRLAKGEINEEEYDHLKSIIKRDQA